MISRAWPLTRRELIFALLAFLSAAMYLGLAMARGAVGFPLDDAWIHQVYARNLGTHGEFAFFPGQPSAGSTSPLWTMLLAIGYALRMDYHWWTYLLGTALIAASSILLGRLAGRLSKTTVGTLTGLCSLFAVFEWHLAWSGVSGMEIPLFVFLSLILLERFYAGERAWALGLIAGLLTLTRPEGSVLAALIGFGFILESPKQPENSSGDQALSRKSMAMLHALLQYAIGFAVPVLPYLAFNLAVSGAIFPNTFYAKNAEYAIILAQVPMLVRFAQTFAAPWVGAQILLVPGFIFIVVKLVRGRDWRGLVPFAWILALPALYALRLPVTYQHGRYEIPVIPLILLYGIWGTVHLFARVHNFVVRGTWVTSTVVALILFWLIGANAYATDSAIINCEMVQTAQWVVQNVSSAELVAAHDIGALGYFYNRPFIDLAGLVSPEVIPIIRDESRLRDFLFSRQAAFVIVFPDWYSSLGKDELFVPVFRTNCAVTRAEGGTNMVVYQIK